MRRLALAAGVVVLAAIWLGPLLGAWRGSFTAHMLAHMGVIAIAAPLLAIGLPERWRPGPNMPVALPLLASLVEFVIVWSWHTPALRAAANNDVAVLAAEQASFLAAGLFLWCTSLAAAAERVHAATGAAALLVTSMHMTLLGALLALSQRPLFGVGDVTCFGIVLDREQDQQFGGVIMLLVGAVIYLTGGVYLVARLLAVPPAADRPGR